MLYRPRNLLFVILISLYAIAGSGCIPAFDPNATPVQRSVSRKELLTSTLNVLNDMRENGFISDDQQREIKKFRTASFTALAILDAPGADPNSTDYITALQQFRAALRALKNIETDATVNR